ncbi:MAG: type III-B CRISPR module RAMP protein Cmr6 [Rhodocyclaceae bacterium]|nr:type III-B CRISPR module RAMP protein Cmr6 [Rhodocyclaceae bacterium]
MRALLQRQQELASLFSPAICWKIQAQCVAPFATGLGNEHPLENGFAFLWPYGLPYLPGSGVKGVIKRAAQELAAGMWPKHPAWQGLDQPLYGIEVGRGANKKRIGLSVLDVLFGREPPPGDPNAVRGALAFWDVIPQIAGDALMVEIMTPHQSHYYQDKREAKSGNSTSPHDSGQPNPIAFLTVPPGSGFCFHIVCDTAHLARLIAQRETAAPDLLAPADDGRPSWQHLVEEAFAHAFQWLGFGAKTTVGYGAMKAAGAAAETSQPETSADSAAAQPQAQAATPTELWQGAELKFNRANKSLIAKKNGKTAIALAPRGEAILSSLPGELRRKIEANQFVRATVQVSEGTLIAIELPS